MGEQEVEEQLLCGLGDGERDRAANTQCIPLPSDLFGSDMQHERQTTVIASQLTDRSDKSTGEPIQLLQLVKPIQHALAHLDCVRAELIRTWHRAMQQTDELFVIALC